MLGAESGKEMRVLFLAQKPPLSQTKFPAVGLAGGGGGQLTSQSLFSLEHFCPKSSNTRIST